MPNFSFPIIFRVPIAFLIFPFVLIPLAEFVFFNQELWIPAFIGLLMFVLCLITYFQTSLTVTENGVIYTFMIGEFEMSWDQIKNVEIRRFARGGKYLALFGPSRETPGTISLIMISKKDLKQFISILREKAPQARLDPKIFELIG
jgi:hypothetical protein